MTNSTKPSWLLEVLIAIMFICGVVSNSQLNIIGSIAASLIVSIIIYFIAKKFWASIFKTTENNHLRTFLAFATAWAAMTAGVIGLMLLSLGFLKVMFMLG